VDATGQSGGVRDDDPAGAGATLPAGQGDVGAGQRDPAEVDLHPGRVAAEVDGFHMGGADAGERMEDPVAGCGVGGDERAGEVGCHPGRVCAGACDVPPASLGGQTASPDHEHGHAQRRIHGRRRERRLAERRRLDGCDMRVTRFSHGDLPE
jgi:hypothetical protein